MAEETIAAIVALQKRATEYSESAKCGYAAAAEKMQEAVVLAQRLPGLPEDNLVALYLMAERCRLLNSQASRTYSQSGNKGDAIREILAASSSSLLLVTAALFRRMDAGTLQPGRCAPLEEAWFASFVADLQQCEPDVSDPDPALFGPCVGLAAMYVAAGEALTETVFSFVSLPQREKFSLVVRALDLLREPRPLEDSLLMPELNIVRKMLTFQEIVLSGPLQRIAAAHPFVAAQLQQVTDAWARVQASDVLQQRGLDIAGAVNDFSGESSERKAEAASALLARRGLRSCNLASCGAKEVHVSHFKSCGACRAVVYCCKEHQVQAWPDHKAECMAARKAAAEDQ